MKLRKIIAFVSSMCMLSSVCTSLSVDAQSFRTQPEEYGDTTYADRFMSLYADVVENGESNGYLSSQNGNAVPYHCVETLNVDDTTDYGHETTSQDVAYLTLVASMRDHIVNDGLSTASNVPTSSSELYNAWNTVEAMIPTTQNGFWSNASNGELSVQYCDEGDSPEDYPLNAYSWNTGVNPIQTYFTSAYSSDSGLYLMHWLADVNDWYGFGGSTAGKEDGSLTFISTFERGSNESVWETIPHACIEELQYGNSNQGIKGGIFNTDSITTKQYSYTSNTVAEDRIIQAVHESIRWGDDYSSITTLTGKMGDESRNTFFDKYYKAINVNTTTFDATTGYESAHYLRSSTSWGGSLDGSYAWQSGSSSIHQANQNPLSAYALLADSSLNTAMKAKGATNDYQTSLGRQLEFYLWLQSEDGPIAGGATNSLHGRYENYSNGYSYTSSSGKTQLITSTFYDMVYLVHPLHEDTPSNQSISTQVTSLQNIAELYYEVAQLGDNSGGVTAGGLSIEDACAKLMDRWVDWSLENIKFGSEAVSLLDDSPMETTNAWAIPSTLSWSGQPDTWTGDGNHDNSNLTCTIESYSQSVGDTATWANSLIYYAAAKGVDTNTTKSADELISSSNKAEKALGYAKKLLDYQWETCRDNIGITQEESTRNMTRFFEETVYVPSNYHGTMPNGDSIENGATFLSIRSSYTDDPDYSAFKEAYDIGRISYTTTTYHRFAEECQVLMANGVMASLFPNMKAKEDETTTETTDSNTNKGNSIIMGEDNWNFNNTYSAFSGNKYYISESDNEKLVSKLDNIDKVNVESIFDMDWIGSCYGMSLTSILAKDGVFDVNAWDSEANYLSELPVLTQDYDTAEESLINYYHASQMTQTIQQIFSNTLRNSTEDNVSRLLELVETVPDGGTPVLICYQQDDFAHAVVGYDVENVNTVIDGVAYEKRIDILDPNNSTEWDSNSEYCIYVDTENSNWCIPAYDISSENGAEFMLIENDLDILNQYSYFSNDSSETTNSIDVAIMESAMINAFNISKISKNANGTINSVDLGEDEIQIYYDFSTDEESTPSSFKASLTDTTSGYRFDTLGNPQSLQLRMMYPNCQITASTSCGEYVDFFPNGEVTISTKDSDFDISVVFNESEQIFDWYSMDITGDDANDVTLSPYDDGFVLSGDNLVDVTITTNNDDISTVTNFTTTEDSVYIYEVDEDTIGVSVDTDNDGTYETDIAQYDIDDNTTVTTTATTKVTTPTETTAITTTETNTSSDTTNITVGDINGDGEVMANDLLMLKKYILQMSTLSDEALANADIDGNGEVLANDLLLLKKVILKMITLDDIAK